MYLAHWGLVKSPFAPGPTPPLYYEGEGQAEASARLRFMARHGRRLAVVVGSPGIGKTATLARCAAERRREGRPTALINLAGLSVRELLWQLAGQLALGPQPGDDAISLFRRVAAYADALRWEPLGACIILDDADQAGPDVRSQLLRLANLGAEEPRLTLTLAATPAGVGRLGHELLAAADLRIELEPFSDAETVGYVQHALLEAGCDRPAFDDEALAVLATLSGGVPRQVNRLADHALLAAAMDELDAVDAATVEASHDALGWIAAA